MKYQITHHLTPALLMGYAAGTLPEAFNLLVASHVSLCDTCRAELASYETLGGAVLDSTAHAMSDNSLEAVLTRIGAEDETPVPLPAVQTASNTILPAPLHAYVGSDPAAIKWRPVGMGVRQAILPTSAAARARLLYIPAGAAVPDHSHHGLEMTLVLQGAFHDEHARFARGDVEIADEHIHHTPVADEGEDCICLAVTDAPLKFNGLLPRLLQPLLRI